MNEPAAARPPIESWRWGVIWLMFLATMINYMDRQAMNSSQTEIRAEFDLTRQGYGEIEFWFGIAYGVCQFPAGFLADRLNLRWLYVVALLVWSGAGFASGLVTSVAALMVCRCVLGVGEAFNWPCAVGIVRRIIPLEARSLANGIFHGGASVGAVLTPLIALLLIVDKKVDWRTLFQIIGAVGLVWAAIWFWFIRGERAVEISRPPSSASDRALDAVSFFEVLRWRTFWITLAVSLSVNFTWHFYRVWFATFLNDDLQIYEKANLWTLTCFFLAADLGSMGAGYLTRRLSEGRSVERARKIVLTLTSLSCVLAIPAVLIMDAWVTLPLMMIVSAGAMGGFPNFFALSQEISPRHTALCLGIFGSTAWMFIAISAPLVGRLVDAIGTFKPVFIAVSFVPLLGATAAWFWPEPKASTAIRA